MKGSLNTILLLVVIILNIALGIYIIVDKQDKRGFVDSQELFEGFEGKKELEKKLKQEESKVRTQMDSLLNIITALESQEGKTEEDNQRLMLMKRSYQQNTQYLQASHQEKATKYTEEVWKQINTYMKDFGVERGYDYIYGVAGLGTLMYGAESHNITAEAINYVNKKYQGH